MKKVLICLLFPFLAQTQVILQLDAFTRTVPEVGFNGNTIRGPSWTDYTFNDSVASMFPLFAILYSIPFQSESNPHLQEFFPFKISKRSCSKQK